MATGSRTLPQGLAECGHRGVPGSQAVPALDLGISPGTADRGFATVQGVGEPRSSTGSLCIDQLVVVSAQDATSLLPTS